MRALIASVVVAASVLAGADEAVGYSGNELWADCQNQKPVTTAEYAIDASCTSYIKAVADVMSGGGLRKFEAGVFSKWYHCGAGPRRCRQMAESQPATSSLHRP